MNTFLTFSNVSLRFQRIEKTILSDIDYEVAQGDFVIVLGGNGSGKSSLIKLIDKRYSPTNGHILYCGNNIKNASDKLYYQSVKTLTQSSDESLFPTLTIIENYQLFYCAHNVSRHKNLPTLPVIKDYLATFNPQLAHKLEQQVSLLSGGEKQALVLALTMLNPPGLLLLDEHTSALDPKSADTIMQLTNEMIRKHKITCLLATHDLDLAARYGDRLLALKEGKMYLTLEQTQKSTYLPNDLRALCY